jgi:hypothetical protein
MEGKVAAMYHGAFTQSNQKTRSAGWRAGRVGPEAPREVPLRLPGSALLPLEEGVDELVGVELA